MANRAKRPCGKPGCIVLVEGDKYCAKHKPLDPPRRESATWHWMYHTKGWKTLRAGQLLAEPFCRECAKKEYRIIATEVDHVAPHKGDPARFYDRGNLQSLCHRCHSRKTMIELNVARRAQATPPPASKMF